MRRSSPRVGCLPNRVQSLAGMTAPPAPKKADPFYLSAEWRQLIARLLRERGRRCQECGRTHDHEGKPIRIFGDHVKELKDGGAPLDPLNVFLRCGSCHTHKTNAEKLRRTANVW